MMLMVKEEGRKVKAEGGGEDKYFVGSRQQAGQGNANGNAQFRINRK
jgi:hypothetical protein